jgi:deoxyribonuclease-4
MNWDGGKNKVRFGVHVSIKNGFTGAGKTALQLGCDGWQMFVGNPRGWARTAIAALEYEKFDAFRAQTQLGPIVVHMAYLPNPATEVSELAAKSRLVLTEDFRRANLLGADFFVLHPGKSKRHDGLERVAAMVDAILAEVSGPTVLLYENQAGMGSELVANLEAMGRLLALTVNRDRVGVCFDTCHAFAAGYDLTGAAGWEATLKEISQTIGLGTIKLFHMNDSRGGLGSHLDRHEHIGSGRIGLAGFEYLVNHPRLSRLPGILETPQTSEDDNHRNLATLRGLIREG